MQSILKCIWATPLVFQHGGGGAGEKKLKTLKYLSDDDDDAAEFLNKTIRNNQLYQILVMVVPHFY